MAEKSSRELDGKNKLTVTLDLDASDAITGLKAIQREAKEATKALRELETYYTMDDDKRYYVKWRQDGEDCTDIREVCMSDIPTEYLIRELDKRKDDELRRSAEYAKKVAERGRCR